MAHIAPGVTAPRRSSLPCGLPLPALTLPVPPSRMSPCGFTRFDLRRRLPPFRHSPFGLTRSDLLPPGFPVADLNPKALFCTASARRGLCVRSFVQ